MTKATTIPQRQNRPSLLGDLPDFQASPLELMLELANEHPPLVKLRFGPALQYVVSDPAAAKHVLQQNNRNYIKEQQMMTITRAVLKSGRNLFTSDGERWLKRRRAMQPSFHRKMVAGFSHTICGETRRITAKWQDGTPVDIEQAMMEATMGVIGQTMLSRDILADYPQLYHAFETASDHIIHRATTIAGRFTPDFLPTKTNRAYHNAIKTIREMLGAAVHERRAMPEAERPADLLTLLLAGRDDESGFTFDNDQLMDELYGIVTAGHETSSITLAAMFYEAASNPVILEKLHAEIDQVLNGQPPTADDLSRLPYLNSVIAETMRRYPAAYVTTRQAVEADQLLGHTIPKGGTVIVNIYGLHHHNELWKEPMVFDPERWHRDEIEEDAFLPFGAGPRKCIGEPLARMEMALIAATILQHYSFALDRTRTMTMQARFTLRAQDGIWLLPQKR